MRTQSFYRLAEYFLILVNVAHSSAFFFGGGGGGGGCCPCAPPPSVCAQSCPVCAPPPPPPPPLACGGGGGIGCGGGVNTGCGGGYTTGGCAGTVATGGCGGSSVGVGCAPQIQSSGPAGGCGGSTVGVGGCSSGSTVSTAPLGNGNSYVQSPVVTGGGNSYAQPPIQTGSNGGGYAQPQIQSAPQPYVIGSTPNSNYPIGGQDFNNYPQTQQPPPPPPPPDNSNYASPSGSYQQDQASPKDKTPLNLVNKVIKPGSGNKSDLYDDKVPDVDEYDEQSITTVGPFAAINTTAGGDISRTTIAPRSDTLTEDYTENSFKSKVLGASQMPDGDSTGDPKCSSETLRLIMQENIVSSPTISKQLIFSAGRLAFGQSIDVVCSKNKFSYTVVSSKVFCEASRGRITCFAFLQP